MQGVSDMCVMIYRLDYMVKKLHINMGPVLFWCKPRRHWSYCKHSRMEQNKTEQN